MAGVHWSASSTDMIGSYANEAASPEVEVGIDVSGGGGIFADSKSRYADLKSMLDSNKDNVKMEAMKRIINMMAKGRDVSELFPAVVKNVAGKNLEVKKLVYVYLVRYAEEQQDLALLSISTFQRGLKDPNQLIRASALRVLSSIRVPMITPILMLAVKESMRDMSPYVRKVAAHAIPKLYSLDPEQKEQLVEVIDYLLADKTTLVVGSAMYAFAEVCAERTELLHKHYRKLCQVLVDVDEWGQVIIVDTLSRYARRYFKDPNAGERDENEQNGDKPFYSEGDDKSGSASESESSEHDSKDKQGAYEMEPDLRLLLRNTKALLQSRNSAVVLSVAALYYHVAPRAELSVIGRSLVRLLRAPREVQSVVLMNIATISAKRRNMFEPFLKSFFVRWNDPTYIKLLKLEVLTNLATQTNITVILREFQTYVQSADKEFAARTIDAIGRCAANIEDVADVCLNGLVTLMSSNSETVVAQSVVVIKRLMQLQASLPRGILIKMSRLLDKVAVPAARASIVWLTGEYCKEVPTVAPDVLRRMAKNFANEADVVRLQVLNLAVKLLITNREQTQLLAEYVFKLARYDNSYDVRDRARFLRNFVLEPPDNDAEGRLASFVHKVFLSPKPAPVLESVFKDRDEFQLGTLSHYLHQQCAGYEHLPDFPTEPPDSGVRDVDGFLTPALSAGPFNAQPTTRVSITSPNRTNAKKELDKFYSEQSSSSAGDEDEEESSAASDSSQNSSSEDATSDGSDDSSASASSDSQSEDKDAEPTEAVALGEKAVAAKAVEPKGRAKKADAKKVAKEAEPADLLLDLDFGDTAASSQPAVAPVARGSPVPLVHAASPAKKAAAQQLQQRDAGDMPTAPAQLVPADTVELLSKLNGGGVSASMRYTRMPSLFAGDMVAVELIWSNESSTDVHNVVLSVHKLPAGLRVAGLCEDDGEQLRVPADGGQCLRTIGVNFADGTQTVELHALIVWDGDSGKEATSHVLSLCAPAGEQLQPVMLGEAQFATEQGRLSGLNETWGTVRLRGNYAVNSPMQLNSAVYAVANVIETTVIGERLGPRIHYAGRTISGKSLLLITLEQLDDSEQAKLTVNCDKIVIGSMIFKSLSLELSV